MESKIIVKMLSDKSCVFQINLLESRHLLICLPELGAGKLRDLWAGQQRDLGAGQLRNVGSSLKRFAFKQNLVNSVRN